MIMATTSGFVVSGQDAKIRSRYKNIQNIKASKWKEGEQEEESKSRAIASLALVVVLHALHV